MFNSFSASLVSLCFFMVESVPTTISNDREGTFSFPVVYRKDATINDRENAVSGTFDATSVVSGPNDNYFYLCPITIGGQTLNIEFDTGSSTSWVFSTLMSNQSPDHTYYDSSQSPSYVSTEDTFNIAYSDGATATGQVGIDTLSILNTQVINQYFGLASAVTGQYLGDGMVGLGFEATNEVAGPTFFDNLKPYLTAPLFAAYIPWRLNGYWDFGATVDSRYTQPIQYAPVDTTAGFWDFNSPSYKVGQNQYPSKGQVAFPDSGTSNIYMQTEQVMNYYDEVEGAQFLVDDLWVFPCESSLPDLSFAVGDDGAYATITGGGDGGMLNLAPYPAIENYCEGALQESENGVNSFGLPFFGEYYIIFDATNEDSPQLGFADLNTDDFPGSASDPSR